MRRLTLVIFAASIGVAATCAAAAEQCGDLETAISRCGVLTTANERSDCVLKLVGKMRRGESVLERPVQNRPAASKARPAASTPSTNAQKIARDVVLGGYLQLLRIESPSLNYIDVKVQKHGSGYTLVGLHPFYGKYSFQIGPLGPAVSDWIQTNRAHLKEGHVNKVEVRSPESGDSSWFDLSTYLN